MDSSESFNVYRCIDPNKTTTSGEWFRIKNICPCNPDLSNPSGRGIVPCPQGHYEVPAPMKENKESVEKIPKGALTQRITPPLFNPYPLVRIGQSLRTIT